VLDVAITSELKAEGIAREIANHVQMLRKTAELDPSDSVVVFYKISSSTSETQNQKKEPPSTIYFL
jgi:hypothetical protein